MDLGDLTQFGIAASIITGTIVLMREIRKASANGPLGRIGEKVDAQGRQLDDLTREWAEAAGAIEENTRVLRELSAKVGDLHR